MRISDCILYFFFKNFIFTIPQLYYGFYNDFSANSLYESFYIITYNCVFTFWPVVIKAINDVDVYYTMDAEKEHLDSLEWR